EQHSDALWYDIDRHLAHLKTTYQSDQISSIPSIAAMRRAYKTLGKDPSRYRGSAEALLRRGSPEKGFITSIQLWTSTISSRWRAFYRLALTTLAMSFRPSRFASDRRAKPTRALGRMKSILRTCRSSLMPKERSAVQPAIQKGL